VRAFASVKEILAVHCVALVRKKKSEGFFSFVQDTHKEINWRFL
jgi:hypothetical protein